jgi:hypothetical protein
MKKEKPIKDLSYHDRIVYRVANEILQEGGNDVGIGAHIESAERMVRLLQKRFPGKKIYVNHEDIDLVHTGDY